MSETRRIETADALYNVTLKLSVVGDFMQTFGDPDTCIRKATPEGLGMIIGECIDTLKTIGGTHDSANS